MINDGSASLEKKVLIKTIKMSALQHHLSLASKDNFSLKTWDSISWRITSIKKFPGWAIRFLPNSLENDSFCNDHLRFQEKAYKTCAKSSWNISLFYLLFLNHVQQTAWILFSCCAKDDASWFTPAVFLM